MDAKKRKAEINRKRYNDPSTGYREYQLKVNKEYYRKNRKTLIEAQKKWNADHKDERREYRRKYMRKRNGKN